MKYAQMRNGMRTHKVKWEPSVSITNYPWVSRCGLVGYVHFNQGPATCSKCLTNKGPFAQEFDAWPDEPDYDPRD